MGEQTNLAQKWEQYVKRFDYCLSAQNITNNGQKRALLLHVSREEIRDLLETLDDMGNAAVLGALNTYFGQIKNIAFDRHVFRQAKQQDDVTDDNFIVLLSKLSLERERERERERARDQILRAAP